VEVSSLSPLFWKNLGALRDYEKVWQRNRFLANPQKSITQLLVTWPLTIMTILVLRLQAKQVQAVISDIGQYSSTNLGRGFFKNQSVPIQAPNTILIETRSGQNVTTFTIRVNIQE
jgi:hypothetical protein